VVEVGRLRAAVANALLFTRSPKDPNPMLQCARVRLVGEVVDIEATDTYALISQQVTGESIAGRKGDDDLTRFVHCDILKSMAAAMRGMKGTAVLRFGTGFELFCEYPEAEVHSPIGKDFDLRPGDDPNGLWPNTNALWPDLRGVHDVPDRFCFGLPMLARLGKILPLEDGQYSVPLPAVIDGTDHLKPFVITVGRCVTVLQMPVRVP
jgi:hypothetical protein